MAASPILYKEMMGWRAESGRAIAFAVKSALVNSHFRLPRRLQTLYNIRLLGEFVDASGIKNLPHFSDRYQLYDYVQCQLIGENAIDYLEFGVFQGASMKRWISLSAHAQSRFFGFDTFEGLPESWLGLEVGHFSSLGKVPDIEDQRLTFFKGLFQKTLGPFMSDFQPKNRLVIHLDADLYTSTLYVLASLHQTIQPGTIMLFDEFGSVNDEFRAFMDYTSSFHCELAPIAWAGRFYEQVGFVVSRKS